MARLPFVVEPKRKPIIERIGSEESGVIEVERRGYLTAGEKSFVQQVQQFDNGSTEIITVSRQVARRHGLGMDKAYNLVIAIIAGTKTSEKDAGLVAEIEAEFAEQLTGVVKGLTASQTREELIQAACLIKYRIDPDFEINEISGIHPDIIIGLANLYRQEEARSIEAFQLEQPDEDHKEVSVEEAEKKSEPTSTSHSKNTTGD